MSIKKLQFKLPETNIDVVSQVLSNRNPNRKVILHEPLCNGILVVCHEADSMQIIAELLTLTYTQDISIDITLSSVVDV